MTSEFVKKKNTRGCVILGSPWGVWGAGGHLERRSDQSRGKTTSEDLKLNRRVRKEERLFAWLSNSAIPVCWRDLGGILFLSGREL